MKETLRSAFEGAVMGLCKLGDYAIDAVKMALDIPPPWVRDGMPEPYVPSLSETMMRDFRAAASTIKHDILKPILRQVRRMFGRGVTPA